MPVSQIKLLPEFLLNSIEPILRLKPGVFFGTTGPQNSRSYETKATTPASGFRERADIASGDALNTVIITYRCHR